MKKTLTEEFEATGKLDNDRLSYRGQKRRAYEDGKSWA